MRSGTFRWLALGGAVWAGASSFAEDDFSARIEKAREAAQANAATTEGRQWKEDHSFATSRLMALVLHRCLPDQEGDIPTAFSVFLRFTRVDGVREVITDLDPGLEGCMTTVAGELPFPKAPRDDYWVQVNMAAPL